MNANRKKIAIVLGGTSPHIALIERLKQRDYYTILIDYYADPPAKLAADQHIQESTLDQEKVFEIAQNLKADLVISACVDQANVTACYVAEKLGLPAPYSYQTAIEVSNKGFMKQKMLENGIPTSKYVYIGNLEQFENSDLAFPVIVKPADSCGSSGVKRANNLTELTKYLSFAKKISRTDKVVVEEFKEGVEVSVYAFVQHKNVHFLMVSQRFSVEEGNEKVIKCYSTVAPASVSKNAMIELQRIANKIVLAFGLENTPLQLHAFINGYNVNIIEFAPRVGGGLSYKTMKLNTCFDIISATIDSYLGIQPNLDYQEPAFFYSVNLIYAIAGEFGRITGHEELLQKQIITDLFPYKSKGVLISEDKASASRAGAFIVKANSKQELLRKVQYAIQNLDVLDVENKSIMRKDLFIKNL